MPPIAQSADRSAEYIADAIMKHINNEAIKPFKADVMGIFVALGGKYTVGEIFNFIKVSGYVAYTLKKAIT